MKKFLFILILIVSAILPTACSCGKEEPTISATRTEVSMAINQTLNIDSLITITGTDNDCEYVISNISVLKIEDGVIKPLTAGRADIKCKIIGYDEIFVVIKVTVRDVKLAHTVSIPKDEIIINIGSGKSAVNKPIFNEEVTEIPNIICDTNIAGYDYATGTVTARAEGETVVRIVYELCEVEFKVIVQKIVFVTNMFVENARLYVGDTGTFDYDVYPTNGNQFRFYEGSDSLEVDSYGVFVAKSPNTVTVYCEYFSEANSDPKVVEFTVEIFALPDNLDFSFVDDSLENLPYIFIGETHKILFDFTEYELLENFSYSSNIEVVSDGIQTDSFGNKYILFKAVESGNLEVTISCNREIENIDRTLSKTREIRVYDYSDIETIARFHIYEQDRREDGSYLILLSDPAALVKELTFSFTVGSYNLTSGIKLYLTNNGKVEMGKTIAPTTVGEYRIIVEYNGHLIDEFTVVAV